MTVLRTVVAAAVASLIVAGCGAPSAVSAPPASAPAAPVSGPLPPSPETAPSPRLVIDTRISGGAVTPTNVEREATVGEPVEIRIDSDVADELHIHSVPGHTFAVEARPGQSFTFTVDVPGQVAVELHELDRTIATLRVR